MNEEKKTAVPAAVIRASLSRAELLENYVDVPKYLGFCRQCPNFRRCWSCPDYDFDPMDVWRAYDRLDVLAYRIEPGTEDPANTDVQKLLEPYYLAMVEELRAAEAATPGALRLNPGKCRLCASCARPEGKPCRFPEEMRYSIESLGGAVGDIAREVLHTPLKWSAEGRPPEYYLLVGGLLVKEKGDA